MDKKSYYFSFCRILMFLCFITGTVYAQSELSGVVKDAETDDPVSGATVLVQGTASGAYTDDAGRFTIQVPGDANTLIVSFFGYEQQEIAIDGQSEIEVSLTTSISTLDEVLVTGYGTQKAKEVTSAITSVDAKDFNGGQVNDAAQLIQGKVAGLVIARPGGNPNGTFNIRLRGLSTAAGNTEPLVVIDGVIGADLGSIDPNDVQSIDILKDGSAAAIYGTRGSNGVIIVTTKTGTAGSSQINYNSFGTIEEVAQTVDVSPASEFRNIIAEQGFDRDLGATTDWFDELTQTGLSQVHNLSLSGGTGQTTYRVSGNFRDIQGAAINTGFWQLNGRINLTQRALNDKLRITVNLAATTRAEEDINGEAFRQATIYNPTAPVRSDDPAFDIYDGFFQEVLFNYFNPVAIAEQVIQEKEEQFTNFNFEGAYDIIPGLTLLGRYSQNRESEIRRFYADKQSFFLGRDRNGLATIINEREQNELIESTLTYSGDAGNFYYTILGGYSYQEFVFDGNGAQGGDFLTDEFTFNNLSGALDFPNGRGVAGSFKNLNKLVAFFGRVNLNYKDTYFLNATVRREGSTLFGENNKYATFPAVSAGVNLASFLQVPWIDNLKFRASYGRTGALPTTVGISQLRLAPSGNFFLNGEYVPSFAPFSNANPDLKWETKDEIDFGFDFSFFNQRLNGSMDYYRRVTEDLIFGLPVPVPPNLVGITQVNVGELRNNGFEFAASYLAVNNNNFTWTPTVNFSTFNTELVSLSNDDLEFGSETFIANLGSPGQNNTPLIRVAEGEPVGQIWGKVFEGVNEDGTWQFADLDGDGESRLDEDDETVIGNGLPDFTIGIANSFTFGNFDANFFLRGSFGHDLVNTFRAFYEVPNQANAYNVTTTEFYDPQLDDSPLFNSIHVEDASFLKLDNATIGYTIPLGENSPFSRLRIYIAGQNLFVLTDYTGVDPEVRFQDETVVDQSVTFLGGQETIANPLAPGIDRRNTYFRTRSYTFGINLGL